jgi:hypothetical protein
VQRSSDTIGTIAAALAKAQAQLVNPEKSLVATIRSDLDEPTVVSLEPETPALKKF